MMADRTGTENKIITNETQSPPHTGRKCARILCNAVLLAAAVLLISYSFYMAYAKGIRKDPFPMPFGYGQAVVTSGSMSPAFEVDALLIFRAEEEYGVGDMVAFSDEKGNLVTHRIIETDGQTVVTKGDANSAADKPIAAGQIYGKAVHIIPGAGKAVRTLQSPVLIIVLLLLLFAGYEWNYSRSRKAALRAAEESRFATSSGCTTERAKPRTVYRRIPGSVLLTGFVLLCALTTGQILAKFVNGAEGAGSARTASFKVTSDLSEFETDIQALMKPGGEEEYTFQLSNASETAVIMTAQLDTEGNLPLKISYKKDTDKNTEDDSQNAWIELTGNLVESWETDPDTGYLSWTDHLEANSGIKSYTIKIEWPAEENSVRYKQGVLALKLRVQAEQAD